MPARHRHRCPVTTIDPIGCPGIVEPAEPDPPTDPDYGVIDAAYPITGLFKTELRRRRESGRTTARD
jgi:hypothetical protein